MSDRYMVIHPDTLEAMRRAGHVAKLEARIEKLEAALRDVYSEVKDEYGFALVEEKIIAALSWEKKDGSYNP